MIERIPLEYIEHYCLDIYFLFEDRLKKDDFIQRFNFLGEEKANKFYRACLSYILSQKCLNCDPEKTTSIALCLLCASIETVSDDFRKYPFRQWLIEYKLDDLENKNKKELKRTIHKAYDEYLEHPQRTGKIFNFTCFLLDHCPETIRIAPITSSPRLVKAVPFKDSIKYIYNSFRSPYIHELLRKVDIENRFSKLDEIYLLEPINKKNSYHIDLKKLPIWFSNVVKESLYEYLIKNT